jgi:hypothetical protein
MYPYQIRAIAREGANAAASQARDIGNSTPQP